MHALARAASLAALLLFGPTAVLAHDPAYVAGRVTVEGKTRAVANALVRIKSVDDARVYTASTDARGRFSRFLLRPGTYTASFEAKGFAAVDVATLVVSEGERLLLNVALTPADEAPYRRRRVVYRRPLVNTEDPTVVWRSGL